MDKIFKFLRKRTKKERLLLMALVDLIVQKKTESLDIKKLTGYDNLFRVRSGKFRVIFKMGQDESVIVKIDERDEQTYRL